MKQIRNAVLLAIVLSGMLGANEDLARLDALIKVTQDNLTHEIALRELIKSYLDLQEQYLKNPDDKEQLLRVARVAVKVMDSIKDNNLASTFTSSFMSELTLFAQVGQKKRDTQTLMPPITFIDRTSSRKETEKVYGGKALAFLYGDDFLSRIFGAPLMHALSRYPLFSAFYGWWQAQTWTKGKVIPFIDHYGVDPSEFLEAPTQYDSFNAFFVRKLKPQARPIDPRSDVAVIPADARYWLYQDISKVDGFVVKGEKFCLRTLLNDPHLAERYSQGSMVIARLCPSDYHRYHFPCSGTAGPTQLINGYLYSVNPVALRKDLSIFTQNKRTLCPLQSDRFGQVLYMEIGATFVGSIHQTYTPENEQEKGSEKGYFSFGASSLILLFEPNKIAFDKDLLDASAAGNEIRCLMGQSMGTARGL